MKVKGRWTPDLAVYRQMDVLIHPENRQLSTKWVFAKINNETNRLINAVLVVVVGSCGHR